MSGLDVSKYAHSPVHKAVVTKDYAALRKIIVGLPQLCDPAEIISESVSVTEEAKADAISTVIDCRNVPNRETPLHLAVKLGDETATEMLMLAGADWSLQNDKGWSALQEAICKREEKIARIIVKHYQPIAWAKWCRRLPRLVSTMRRMRDFYMEITFQFESSVIPFISRIAPSDTYKIWKRGANLRADMTLAGFDGFKIQRSDQSIVFLGDGSEDGKVPPGSLCMITHKDKEMMNALDGAGAPASDLEVQQEVTAMSQTNIFRPGIDVTQAVLLPQMTWRRQEKAEMVGPWKAKVYDMHNVVVSIKSRRVPGAMTDDELFSSSNENENESGSEELNDILTEEERRQLEAALKLDSSELNNENNGLIRHRHSCYEQGEIPIDDISTYRNGETKQEKKGWFDGWRKRDSKQEGQKKGVPPRGSLCVEDKVSDLLGDSPSQTQIAPGRHSMEIAIKRDEQRKGKDSKASSSNTGGGNRQKDGARENEYKKGLRPVLWLSPNFPLKTEELLPLLDILANKVKAVRRLRDLLTTKLPLGTFPVKVAIPVIPTIRVLVTFTKFEELQAVDEFITPPSSPTAQSREIPAMNQSSNSSWFQWIKTPYNRASSSSSGRNDNVQDPFAIPSDYTWVTAEAKKKKMQEKSKSKKGDGHGCGRSDRRLITTNRRGLKVPPFLNKVYDLVNDPKTNDIISWTSDGTSFTVWDHHMFTKNILPAYFRHDNFSSFVYQLNNYGFKKTSWDNWEYENKWFQQGKDYMLVNIKRKNQISSVTKRNRAVSLSSDNLVCEAPLESEHSENNQVKLELQKLVKKQEIMEKELGTIKDQIESLFKQQKIVVSMFSAFLPKFGQHLNQNVIEQGVMEEAEFEKETAEKIKSGNGMELVVADHYTSQQNGLFDSGNLMENTENLCYLEKLMAIDENQELQGELANQQSNIVMELEGLMTQAELGGYIEFMSQVEFPETKPAI